MSNGIESQIAYYDKRIRKGRGWIDEQEVAVGVVDGPCGCDVFGRLAKAGNRVTEMEAMATWLRGQLQHPSAAEQIVETVVRSSLRPGTPLPYTRIVAATIVKGRGQARDRAEAELLMFDGKTARFECENYGREPDAYKSRWSRVEGGDLASEDGEWRRAPDAAQVKAEAPVEEQLDLKTCIETTAAPMPGMNDVSDLFVAAGVAPSLEHLRLYGIPCVRDDPPAPSRMYRFPAKYVHARFDEHDHAFIVDKGLRDLPRVRHIAEIVGDRPEI